MKEAAMRARRCLKRSQILFDFVFSGAANGLAQAGTRQEQGL